MSATCQDTWCWFLCRLQFWWFRVMLVGLGGNNGSTLMAGVIANREWVVTIYINNSWLVFLILPVLIRTFHWWWLIQGNLMGDQGQGPAGQLLWLPHPGFHHQGRKLQRRGDLCALQEPAAHGSVLCFYYSHDTKIKGILLYLWTLILNT